MRSRPPLYLSARKKGKNMHAHREGKGGKNEEEMEERKKNLGSLSEVPNDIGVTTHWTPHFLQLIFGP